jgi:hypothetical protein
LFAVKIAIKLTTSSRKHVYKVDILASRRLQDFVEANELV